MGEAYFWTNASVNRAAKAVAARQAGKPDCGYTPALPRTDKVLAEAATGVGLTWDENGRTMKAQVWCPGPYVRSYWMKVWERCAYFRGEMRLAVADKDGRLSFWDSRSYDAQGRKTDREAVA